MTDAFTAHYARLIADAATENLRAAAHRRAREKLIHGEHAIRIAAHEAHYEITDFDCGDTLTALALASFLRDRDFTVNVDNSWVTVTWKPRPNNPRH